MIPSILVEDTRAMAESAGPAFRLYIGEADLLAIAAHATAASPEEACGVLIGFRNADEHHVAGAVPLANACEASRLRAFSLEPAALAELLFSARRCGEEIVGFYHSHPDSPPEPSTADLAAAWCDHSYLIVGIAFQRGWTARSWRRRWRDHRMAPERLISRDAQWMRRRLVRQTGPLTLAARIRNIKC